MFRKIKKRSYQLIERYGKEKSHDSILSSSEQIYFGVLGEINRKRHLVNFVKGKRKPFTKRERAGAKNYHNCRLGKWLYGVGKKQFAHSIEWKELELFHMQVHLTADHIIHLCEIGCKIEALEVLKKEYIPLANNVQRFSSIFYRKIINK